MATRRMNSAPQVGGLVPLPDAPVHTDAGTIWNLAHECKGTVSVLECLPGSTRSKHSHPDAHWLFVASGKALYYERPAGSREDVAPIVVNEGELFFTPGGVEHKVFFPVRTILVSLATSERRPGEHDKKITRVEWP